MDPNATLRELLAAIRSNDIVTATELAAALDQLLKRGGFSPLQSTQSEYQGWKNYETWAIHLSLTADETADQLCRSLTRRAIAKAATAVPVVKGTWTVEQAQKYLLADYLKDFVDNRSPLVDSPSVYSNLLGSALCEVDWSTIAEAFLERGSA